jgi:hypothetical protein
MAQHLTRYRVYWHGEWIEGGHIVEDVSPDDDEILAYWTKWMALVPYEPPPPPEEPDEGGGDPPLGETLPEPPGEGEDGGEEALPHGGTPPMTSRVHTSHPSHVGRRTR